MADHKKGERGGGRASTPSPLLRTPAPAYVPTVAIATAPCGRAYCDNPAAGTSDDGANDRPPGAAFPLLASARRSRRVLNTPPLTSLP